MTFWSLPFVCKMTLCRPPLGDPLKLSVIVAYRWRHLQYSQDSPEIISIALTKISVLPKIEKGHGAA